MERLEDKITNGLNKEQVEKKIASGLVNGDQGIRSRSYGQIVRSNLLSLFNLINVILLVCILISGSYKNTLFFLVVIWNFGIGVFQEIRAKKTIEKLSLLCAPTASVVRDGSISDISDREIVLGDIMKLDPGKQICCDCVILQGSCHVNESMVTGESEPVYKKAGDHLLSGSFVSQGSIFAEVEHVGKDSYVNLITTAAGKFDKRESVIMHAVRSIVKAVAVCIIPLTALFVWNNFFRLDQEFSAAMVKTVAAVSSMIPGGLVLLVSIVLAVSVVRLAAHHTLVQDLYSVEHLARVDTLLLDKTGTITKGVLSVNHILTLNEKCLGTDALSLLKLYAQAAVDENPTMQAIREYLGEQDRAVLKNAVCSAFSSERKWGMVYLPDTGTLILGAPDRILVQKECGTGQVMSTVSEYAAGGKRVLLFAVSDEAPKTPEHLQDAADPLEPDLPDTVIPALLIVIDEQVRPEAPETFRFFREEGVTIKVISGDNPLTVSRIAEEAGLDHAQDFIDASELDEEDLKAAASKYTVFGRVKPDQKLEIVKTLQSEGHVVAMTGDGANDVLALRAADCSIAMQSGTDAARYASDIVLLDSDFSSLPLVVAQGRMSINNLQRSASLYLTKTVYAFVFAVFFIFASYITYPFENIQVTLIGAVTIGIPSFFLALEPNRDRVKGDFLKNVLKNAIPAGVLEAAALIISSCILKGRYGADGAQLSTAAVFLMMIMGIVVVIKTGGKFRLWKVGLVLLLCGICIGAAAAFPGLFSIVSMAPGMWLCLLVTSAVFTAVYLAVAKILR